MARRSLTIRRRILRIAWAAGLALAGASDGTPSAAEAAPAAPPEAAVPAAGALSAEALDELVAPIALYPDELLSIVLAGATEPLQIVQAARFLEAREKNPKLEADPDWDPAVVSLLNYPEVVDKLNADLDWTSRLGDAVSDHQEAVMESVQQVRARAEAAGNLETTEQVVVEQQQDVIVVRSADPEIVYVPSYDPQVIYVPQPAPVVSYAPRPCYWCPAATFGISMATGFAVGMTTAWMFDWHHHAIGWGPGWGGGWGGRDIDIDRNVNIDRGDVHIDNSIHNNNTWKSNKNKNKPGKGQGGQGANRPGGGDRPGMGGGNRPGGGDKPGMGSRPGGGDRPGGGGRPETKPAKRPGSGSATARPSTRPGSGSSGTARPGGQGGKSQSSLGSYQRGRDTVKQSQRGAQSRQHSAGKASGSLDRGGSSARSKSSFGGYQSASRSKASSSRGHASRGGGGGHRGGGGGGGGRGGGGRR
jgi:hypothetical protein